MNNSENRTLRSRGKDFLKGVGIGMIPVYGWLIALSVLEGEAPLNSDNEPMSSAESLGILTGSIGEIGILVANGLIK